MGVLIVLSWWLCYFAFGFDLLQAIQSQPATNFWRLQSWSYWRGKPCQEVDWRTLCLPIFSRQHFVELEYFPGQRSNITLDVLWVCSKLRIRLYRWYIRFSLLLEVSTRWGWLQKFRWYGWNVLLDVCTVFVWGVFHLDFFTVHETERNWKGWVLCGILMTAYLPADCKLVLQHL